VPKIRQTNTTREKLRVKHLSFSLSHTRHQPARRGFARLAAKIIGWACKRIPEVLQTLNRNPKGPRPRISAAIEKKENKAN
jgi:hypothetical protein